MVEVKKLTAAHIRKIKETYKKKGIGKKHSKIMVEHWDDKKHVYNKPVYRKKLAEAKVGPKNPNSKTYRKLKR